MSINISTSQFVHTLEFIEYPISCRLTIDRDFLQSMGIQQSEAETILMNASKEFSHMADQMNQIKARKEFEEANERRQCDTEQTNPDEE